MSTDTAARLQEKLKVWRADLPTFARKVRENGAQHEEWRAGLPARYADYERRMRLRYAIREWAKEPSLRSSPLWLSTQTMTPASFDGREKVMEMTSADLRVQIRLDCLKLAVQSSAPGVSSARILEAAEEFYDFVES